MLFRSRLSAATAIQAHAVAIGRCVLARNCTQAYSQSIESDASKVQYAIGHPTGDRNEQTQLSRYKNDIT